jgi:methylenetetrahydrofolate reductase (NADPH)
MSITSSPRWRRRPDVGRGLPADVASQRLARDMRFEVVPLKTAEAAIAHLPPASPVSVTCSPTKGIAATLDLTARLRDLGHEAVPHLAARLVTGPDQSATLAAWCRDHGVAEVFVVGGDSPSPRGPYTDAIGFLRDLLDAAGGDLRRIGVAAYPNGHVLIERPVLREALLAKQALLEDAGVAGYATTQMCFEPLQIRAWLATERLAGLRLPIHLGVAGVVDRRRLLTMGLRVGIGASLRYVRKNTGMLRPLMSGGRMTSKYDPSILVDAIAPHAGELGIEGLHAFTFNSVGPTANWRDQLLGTALMTSGTQ